MLHDRPRGPLKETGTGPRERQYSRTCEPEPAGKLTPESQKGNLGLRVRSGRFGPEVTVAVRRPFALLLLAACLMGIVQPALACAPRTDCCPTGSTGGCAGQTCQPASWLGAHSRCATSAIAPSSASISARPHHPQTYTPGPPDTAHLGAMDLLPRDRVGWTSPPCVIADTVFDESLTYLRTARLRL